MNQSFSDLYYQTTDLALSAVISLSFPLDSIDKTTPTKAQFIFKRTEGLDELIEGYWKQELKVELYADNYKPVEKIVSFKSMQKF